MFRVWHELRKKLTQRYPRHQARGRRIKIIPIFVMNSECSNLKQAPRTQRWRYAIVFLKFFEPDYMRSSHESVKLTLWRDQSPARYGVWCMGGVCESGIGTWGVSGSSAVAMRAKASQRMGSTLCSTAHLIMVALAQLELSKSFLWQMYMQARIEAAVCQEPQRPVASSQDSSVQSAVETSRPRALAFAFSIAMKVLREEACLVASTLAPGLRVENGGGGRI
jgi:hypothetical protein